VGKRKGKGGKTAPDAAPAVSPEMSMPGAEESRVVRLESSSVRASRMNHPSTLARRIEGAGRPSPLADPRVIFAEGDDVVDLSDCDSRCGNGERCNACRAEIRAEALRWLRELNAPRAPAGPVLAWSRPWSHNLLLADH
jgi:hypothetical protein